LDEAEVMRSVLSRISERAKRPTELGYLVRRWNSFAVEVEQGYGGTIHDYTNDVSVRDLLAEVIAALSPSSARAIEESIAAADETYRRATTVSSKTLLPLPPGVHSWWWFRVPSRLTDELRQDLIDDGFLDDSAR
jgi:hypothetical protein